MSAVVLLLAPDRYSAEAIARAVERAAETGAELHALYIIDPEAAQRVHRTVGQTGFVGETACDALCASVQAGYEQQGRATLAEVETAARPRVPRRAGQVVTGAFVATALRRIAEVHATDVVVARRPGSRLRRMVRGSEVEALQRAAPCPVTILAAGTSTRPPAGE